MATKRGRSTPLPRAPQQYSFQDQAAMRRYLEQELLRLDAAVGNLTSGGGGGGGGTSGETTANQFLLMGG